ncbi:MAG: hypothetical protein CM15mP22_7390 [Gammaproteobacteria bacterium]|nr:MAG: hypothetical protein CM15mP22_7390 [Gammaproteobacteria bacterium]
MEWMSRGGTFFSNFDAKKVSFGVNNHGGPHAMYRPQFNYLWHQFASDGFVVLS